MSAWTSYQDAPRPTTGRPYRAVQANRAEQLVVAVAADPGHPTRYYADVVGTHFQYVFRTATQLAARGLLWCRIEQATVGTDRRERRVWFVTDLVRDVLEGRDHPGTPLGTIRAALEDRPRSLHELHATTALPFETLRTLLRLLVLRGDLERRRHAAAERYALPAVLEDEDDGWEVAA